MVRRSQHSLRSWTAPRNLPAPAQLDANLPFACHAVLVKFEMMTPQKMADELLKTIGDADSNTAHTALKIAELLLVHRDHAQLDFERELLNDPS
jgi:hypothetical protein